MSDASAKATPDPPATGSASSTPLVAVIAGAAMGLLVGTLIGLSTTSVVGSVLSSLTALIGAFLGLATTSFNANSWRIAGFGVVCAAAVVGGVYMRAHGALQPALKAQMDELQQAGFDVASSREIIAYHQFGIVPSGKVVQVNEVTKGAQGVLFANATVVCTPLKRAVGEDVKERLAALASGGEVYKQLAEQIGKAAPERQSQLVDSMKSILCGE